MAVSFRFTKSTVLGLILAFILALSWWIPSIAFAQSDREDTNQQTSRIREALPVSSLPSDPRTILPRKPVSTGPPVVSPSPTDPVATSATTFNVKNFGAVCDGKRDDTVAIQTAYDAAAQAMASSGGAGIVYFPPSTGFCVVGTLHTPSMGFGQGWLTTVFDNGLFIKGTFYPGNDNAFIGRTSNFGSMAGSFLWGPTAEWEKPHWSNVSDDAVVTLAGVREVYFEGINIADAAHELPLAISGHNSASILLTNINFKHCSIIGNIAISPDFPGALTGFGWKMQDTSVNGNMSAIDFGSINIDGGFLHKMFLANQGTGEVASINIDGVVSEALTNEDFLTVDSSLGIVSDITLHAVSLADTVGSVYMLKNIEPNALPGVHYNTNVKFDMIPLGNSGSGLIDPASTPQLISAFCNGYYCDTVLNQAKNTLYVYYGFTIKSGLIVYGSQFVPNPISMLH